MFLFVFPDIPYFKQVVIMCTLCEECGYRTNEVKPGGGIEKQGITITVRVESAEDLNRDILKVIHCIHFISTKYIYVKLFYSSSLKRVA